MIKRILLLAFTGTIAASVQAEGLSATQTETMKSLLANYAVQAKAAALKAKTKPITAEDFSAETGKKLFMTSRNWEGEEAPSCSTCHTNDPKAVGKHTATKETINPLAPAANPERFVSVEKVERNFSKHCREIYSRDCDPAEKGHFLTYLMSVK
jgi:cytochrome c peroxidase